MKKISKKKRHDDLERFVSGAFNYLSFSLKNGISESQIVETLAHDIGGLFRREDCFSARVNSYANGK